MAEKKRKLPQAEEAEFQQWIRSTGWFSEFVKEFGEEPDLDIKEYDYRAAWKAGVVPQRDPYDNNRYHWASSTAEGAMLKGADHPTAWKEQFMREYGSNPDEIGVTEDVYKRMKGFSFNSQ